MTEAITHYCPTLHKECSRLRHLLVSTLIPTGNTYVYTLGARSIPMDIPLAPQLARLYTTYLLPNYIQPGGHLLRIYIDDVTAIYPTTNLPLHPYTLLESETNATQDCTYNPALLGCMCNFVSKTQKYRQAVLLHLHCFHPSTKLCVNIYVGSAF